MLSKNQMPSNQEITLNAKKIAFLSLLLIILRRGKNIQYFKHLIIHLIGQDLNQSTGLLHLD